MLKLLLKFYKLFKLTFLSPKGTVSSKRLIGFLMITEAGFLIAYSVFMKLHFDKSLDENLVSLLSSLLYTGGARFVLIKRTDSTGDWVTFDTARGIVAGNDPYLELNTSDAEVTDKDAVDTDNSGFVVNETTGPNVNTNTGTYIYLAIA